MKLQIPDPCFRDKLRWDDRGLIPAVVQDWGTRRVVMMAYMNSDSLGKTLTTGQAWFWSRRRQTLWHKGETSGSVQLVREITYDCDADTLLLQVEQQGTACHTGKFSCFHHLLARRRGMEEEGKEKILEVLAALLRERRRKGDPTSYVCRLFDEGLDRIAQKLGEEAVETIIAAKNGNREEIIYEAADLLFHLLVLLEETGVAFADLLEELARRRRGKKND